MPLVSRRASRVSLSLTFFLCLLDRKTRLSPAAAVAAAAVDVLITRPFEGAFGSLSLSFQVNKDRRTANARNMREREREPQPQKQKQAAARV